MSRVVFNSRAISNTLATWCEELTHWKRPWCWERLKAGREGDNRGWDGWMVSPTRWTWVWASFRSWWWTGKPGVLQSTGLQTADSLEKTLMLGQEEGQEKGTTEDEMDGWHHRLDGHEFEHASGVGDGQGSLACCSPWGRKESDTTEQLNWTESPSTLCLLGFMGNMAQEQNRWKIWYKIYKTRYKNNG